jgi:hypothetical protein
MPKLRLSEVIAEQSIIVADLNTDVQETINTLLTQETTLGKIDKATAEKLRLIAKSLDVSLFDLFTSVEKFYRLKIFEYLNEPEYSGSQKENLEKLFAKLPSSSKISFNLLTLYATQILPESLLTSADLKQICKLLGITLEALKDIFDLPRQTISVESILLNQGITLDEFSLLIEVPKKFIPWISLEVTKSNTANNEGIATEMINTSPCNYPIFCYLNPDCPRPC